MHAHPNFENEKAVQKVICSTLSVVSNNLSQVQIVTTQTPQILVSHLVSVGRKPVRHKQRQSADTLAGEFMFYDIYCHGWMQDFFSQRLSEIFRGFPQKIKVFECAAIAARSYKQVDI